MNDDIVARLRKAFDIWLSHGEVDDLAWSEAANEIERLESLIGTLRREVKHLDFILDKTFTFANGHQPNCLMGMMCGCGYMHWHARQEAKK